MRGGDIFHMTGPGERLWMEIIIDEIFCLSESRDHTLHQECKSIPQGDYYDPLQIFSLSEQYFKQHEKYIF